MTARPPRLSFWTSCNGRHLPGAQTLRSHLRFSLGLCSPGWFPPPLLNSNRSLPTARDGRLERLAQRFFLGYRVWGTVDKAGRHRDGAKRNLGTDRAYDVDVFRAGWHHGALRARARCMNPPASRPGTVVSGMSTASG